MKAAVLYGDYDLRFEDWPEPEIRAGCVKIHVRACGICGSDYPRMTNGKVFFYPIVLGHEFSGEIVEVASDVTALQAGDHVAAVPLVPCMQCKDCALGHYSQCKQYSFIGTRLQGGFGEYVVIPQQNAVKIDKSVPFEQGALFEPSTVALHGIRLTDYQGGKNVAVIGGGTIGLFTLQWAKILGARNVIVFGRNKAHLEVSKRLGADEIISTLDEGFLEKAKQFTDGKGFDYVFEAAGSSATIKLAFQLAGNHANVCMIGTPSSDITFTSNEWKLMNQKEFRLTGSWMSGSAPFPGDEWKLTADCYADGRLKYDPDIFYKQISIRNTEEVVETIKDRSVIKGRVLLIHDYWED